jgi:type III secretion system chaperone SycN
MQWVEEALRGFGHYLGVDELSFSDHGLLELTLENGSVVAIEDRSEASDQFLIYLRRPVGYQAAAWLRKALVRCHAECHSLWPLQVALRGQGTDTVLILLTRVSARGFTPQALSQAIEYQLRWSETLRPTP